MPIRPVLAICLAMACALPGARAAAPAPAEAESAQPDRTLHAQVLLARARFSPGQIDGIAGSNQARALRGFQAARDLPESGEVDEATWEALDDGAPALVERSLTEEDLAAPYHEIPEDMIEKAELERLGYGSAWEALGERFQASPELLRSLNPDTEPKAGATLRVPNVRDLPELDKAARVVVDESDGTLVLLDGNDRTMAQFPVTSGSEHDPLPIGEWTVEAIARDPTFHYNPELFWDADESHAKATIAPGPNNPVGSVWIDLSKPHYGIHGTPEPASVGKTASHGCIRLTNWDALTVAAALEAGTPVVMQE